MSTDTPPKIKILFLGANPSNTTHLALGNEVREITQRLRAAHQGEQFEFVQEWAMRVGDLQAALLRHKPQIVHFSGHGQGDGDAWSRSAARSVAPREMLPVGTHDGDDADGEILVEDDTGKAKPLPALALARLFKIVGGIRCVVLNACHSASQADAIRQHVDAVISMRRSINDMAAVHFAWAFYQGLGFGESLDKAFELGRNQIELAGFGDGDVPQLLTSESAPFSSPRRASVTEPPPTLPIKDRPSWRPPESGRDEDRVDPFLIRVERVAKLRHPGARITRVQVPAPFAGVLEVEVDAGGFSRMSIVTALNQAVTEELAARFSTEIDQRFRRSFPQLRSTLVHRGNAAPLALRVQLDRLGIELQTFDSYQGLFDLQPYIEWQSRELEKNPAYLASSYVDPRAWVKVAGSRELEHTENALQTISELLAAQAHRRFLLVLGEFGAGKTFLLRELCRHMVKTNHPVVPVLLEMSKLEKQHNLAELLGAHFARADVPGYNFKAFDYLLGEGRIALFFDGFDELADKVTYDSATQHLDTVLSAAHGQAKVVLSSRRQHFLTEGDIHKAVEREFARKAESAVQGGYRLIMLQPFEDPQIRRYLHNVLVDKAAAEGRYRLLDEVKDLLGLSHNPRMLSFISAIPEESLREAKEQWGEITAAKLYELLVNHWLDFEYGRSRRQGPSMRISRQALLRGVESLALSMWQARSKWISVEEIHAGITQSLAALGEPPLDRAILTHIFGSGSLLVRDEDGRFSFVHRSVMEWLVAKQAADELLRGQDPPALVADEMSVLMADFFAAMAGRELAAKWAREKVGVVEELILRKNATLLLTRMGERFERVNFEGQDLRGKDFSGVDWRGANLRGADLRGATLQGANLRGASLVGANLSHADLRGANLTQVELAGADLSFVRAESADFSKAEPWDPNRFRGANLFGAKGIAEGLHEDLRAAGASTPALWSVEPMFGARSPCRSIAWSPVGSIFATGHDDGTVRINESITGKVLRVLSNHTGAVRGVAFSPNAQTLASASDDKTVRLWDIATSRIVRSLVDHTAQVKSVAFAPDGSTVVSGSDDNTLRLWNVATGHCVNILNGHTSGIRSVTFSPNGGMIASGSKDGTVRLWDVGTCRPLRILKLRSSIVYSVVFSPNGKTLAAGSLGAAIQLWDIATGDCERSFAGHMHAINSLAFSPDGRLLASASKDRTFRLWEVETGRSLGSEGQSAEVFGVAFSPDGRMLALAMDDGTVEVWHLGTSRKTNGFAGHRSSVRSVAFSPDGKALAVGSSNNIIRLWDPLTGTFIRPFENGAINVRKVVFSPDGKKLASASSGVIWLWDVGTGRVLSFFDSYVQEVYCIEFSPDGKTLAVASNGSIVKLWDIEKGVQLRAFDGHESAVYAIAFSPDGKTLASGSVDATIRIWDVSTGRAVRTIEGHPSSVLSIAFTADGKSVVSGSNRSTIHLWEIATCRMLRTFDGHGAEVRSIALSPNNAMIVSGSYDNTVRLWDVTTGHTIRIFEGHASGVLSVCFSPDGKTIASGSYDNTVRLWDVATGQCLAILLATPEGWVAFTPDGRYKYGGNIAGSFWHVAGLCRFEPGELDEYLNLRLADDALFLPAKP